MRLRELIDALRDRRGVAAIELAMVAPVIGGVVVMSFGVWEVGTRRQDMRAALDVAVEYYMNGGSDDSAARTLANNAWRNRPPNASVSTNRICRCGDTPLACTSLCPGSIPPSVFVTLTASGEQPAALMQTTLTSDRVVRVR